MKRQSWLLVIVIGIAFFVIVFNKSSDTVDVEEIVYQQTEDVKPAAELSVDVQRDLAPPSTEINGNTQTELFVVDAFDNSVASAVVHYYSSAHVVGKIVVDAEGYAIVDNDTTIVGVIVVTDNRLPYYQKATFVGEDVRLKIPAGESLRGKVVFKDCEPDALFEVGVPLHKLVDETEIPSAVIKELRGTSAMPMSLSLTLSDEGIFEINGLPKSWSGRLYLGEDYWICSVEGGCEMRGGSTRVPQPATDIVINLHKSLWFKGRVVASDTGEGVQVNIHAAPRFAAETHSTTSRSWMTAPDGSFSAPIRPHASENKLLWCADRDLVIPIYIDIEVSNSVTTFAKQFEIDLSAMPAPWDLGELRVDVKQAKVFTVTDHNGVALAEAVVISSEASKPTDSNGQTDVYPLPDAFEYKVGAEGYETKVVTLSDGDVLACSLEPSATLTVHWPSPLPAGLERIQIQIESEGSIFNNDDYSSQVSFWPRLAGSKRARAGSMSARADRWGWTRWRLDPDASDQFFWDLKPNTIMKVCLVDSDGKVLTNKQQFVVSAKEKLSVDLSFL